MQLMPFNPEKCPFYIIMLTLGLQSLENETLTYIDDGAQLFDITFLLLSHSRDPQVTFYSKSTPLFKVQIITESDSNRLSLLDNQLLTFNDKLFQNTFSLVVLWCSGYLICLTPIDESNQKTASSILVKVVQFVP